MSQAVFNWSSSSGLTRSHRVAQGGILNSHRNLSYYLSDTHDYSSMRPGYNSEPASSHHQQFPGTDAIGAGKTR